MPAMLLKTVSTRCLCWWQGRHRSSTARLQHGRSSGRSAATGRRVLPLAAMGECRGGRRTWRARTWRACTRRRGAPRSHSGRLGALGRDVIAVALVLGAAEVAIKDCMTRRSERRHARTAPFGDGGVRRRLARAHGCPLEVVATQGRGTAHRQRRYPCLRDLGRWGGCEARDVAGRCILLTGLPVAVPGAVLRAVLLLTGSWARALRARCAHRRLRARRCRWSGPRAARARRGRDRCASPRARRARACAGCRRVAACRRGGVRSARGALHRIAVTCRGHRWNARGQRRHAELLECIGGRRGRAVDRDVDRLAHLLLAKHHCECVNARYGRHEFEAVRTVAVVAHVHLGGAACRQAC